MSLTQLRDLLGKWRNLGPLGTIEGQREAMMADARAMGPALASVLVDALMMFESEGPEGLEALPEFLEVYGDVYPDALADTLLDHVSPSASPMLIEALGTTGSRRAATRLADIVRTGQLDNHLVVSIASALGEIGGAEALHALCTLANRSELSKEAQAEVKIALGNLFARSRANQPGDT